MATGRRGSTTPLIRGSRAIASNRSPSSVTLRRGRDVKRCHSGRGGSGSVGRSLSRTKMTNSGGLPNERRSLEVSHQRERNWTMIRPPHGDRGRVWGGGVRRRSEVRGVEGDVGLVEGVLQVVEQHRHPVAGGVLQRERDEDETDAKLGEGVPRDRVLLVVPLEGRRVVEGEPCLWKSRSEERRVGKGCRSRWSPDH